MRFRQECRDHRNQPLENEREPQSCLQFVLLPRAPTRRKKTIRLGLLLRASKLKVRALTRRSLVRTSHQRPVLLSNVESGVRLRTIAANFPASRKPAPMLQPPVESGSTREPSVPIAAPKIVPSRTSRPLTLRGENHAPFPWFEKFHTTSFGDSTVPAPEAKSLRTNLSPSSDRAPSHFFLRIFTSVSNAGANRATNAILFA